MYKYLNLIVENQNFIQIGIDNDSPMTLFIKVNQDGFSGFGSIYFDDLSITKMKNDFSNFLNCKLNQFEMNDTDSNDYYISVTRNKGYIEFKGEIGNYTTQTLEFFVEFLETKMIEKSEIIKLINEIKI